VFVGVALVGWGGGRKKCRRMNMVQIMYTQVWKYNNNTSLNCSRNQRREDVRQK
jgi:hypothetical protein